MIHYTETYTHSHKHKHRSYKQRLIFLTEVSVHLPFVTTRCPFAGCCSRYPLVSPQEQASPPDLSGRSHTIGCHQTVESPHCLLEQRDAVGWGGELAGSYKSENRPLAPLLLYRAHVRRGEEKSRDLNINAGRAVFFMCPLIKDLHLHNGYDVIPLAHDQLCHVFFSN